MATEVLQLKTRLEGSTLAERAASLNAAAWEIRNKDAARAMELAREAVALTQAHAGANAARELAPELAEAQSILAYLCTKQADFDEALRLAMTALSLLDRSEAPPERRLRPLLALFIVHRKLGAPAEALKYALEALEIAEQVDDRDNQARFLANVGTMYADTANYEAALEAYLKAIDILEERANHNSIVLVLNNMCDVSRALGDYEAALEHAQRALKIAVESGNPMYVPVIRASIGEVYETKGDEEEALRHYRESLETLSDIGSLYHRAYLLRNIGRVLNSSGRYEDALEPLLEGVEIATNIRAEEERYACHRELAAAYEGLSRFDHALKHFKQYHAIRASVASSENDERQRHLEVRYRTNEMQREAEIYRLKTDELERMVSARTRELSQRLEMERIMNEISADLVRRSSGERQDALRNILGLVGGFSEAAAGALLLCDPAGERIRRILAWVRPDSGLSRARLRHFRDDSAACLGPILDGQALVEIKDPASLPEEAAALRDFLTSAGLGSCVLAGLDAGGRRLGAIAYGCAERRREWDPESLQLFNFTADILASAISRWDSAEALSVSEERFRLLFDEAAVGAAIISLDGPVLRVNRALCDILGYSPEELGKISFGDIAHPDDEENTQRSLDALLADPDQPYEIEKRYYRKDGTLATFIVQLTVERDLAGAPLHLVAQFIDISQRIEVERSLRQTLSRTEALYRVARATANYRSVGDLLQNIAELTRGIMDADAVFLATFDHASKALEYEVWGGQDLSGLLRPSYRFLHDQLVDYLLTQSEGHLVSQGGDDPRLSKSTRYQAFREAGGGSLILAPLQAHDQRLGIMMVASRKEERVFDSADTDLSEAIANQIALVLDHTSLLTRENQRLQEIVDAIPEGILLFDREAPHVVRWANAVAHRNLGVARSDLAGHPLPIEDLGVTPIDLARLEGDLSDARAELRRRDGSPFWARLSIRPASFDRRSALLATFVDIEDQKKAEAAVERLEIEKLRAMFETEQRLLEQERITNAKLREVDRLKSSMLRNMSHEIRTPLNSILGFAQILTDDLDDEALRPLAEMIDLSGQRLMDTLNSVLDLAQLEGGAFELSPAPVDLVALSNEARSLFAPQARQAGLALVCSAEQPEILASADPAALNRVLANLVSNAIRFTPRGTVSLHIRREDDQAVLAVSDTGVGIDPAFAPYIFEPFRQESEGSARTHEGSGLGLSISRQLLEHMNGSIEVESAKGVGSTFTVRLPLWQGPSEDKPA